MAKKVCTALAVEPSSIPNMAVGAPNCSRGFDILPPWALAFLDIYVHIDNFHAYRTMCAHNLK